MSGDTITIRGRAYAQPATLEVTDDRLIWRGRRSDVDRGPENIATSLDDVRDVSWIEKRWSGAAAVLACLAIVWMVTEGLAIGAITMGLAGALAARQMRRPRYWLGLDLGTRWLVLRVDPASAASARALADRIRRRLLTGEVSVRPPALP